MSETNKKPWPEMVTLKEASRRTNMSYDFLRKLCINDRIVYVRAGNKYLVNFEKLVDFLNKGMKQQPEAGAVL